MSSVLRDMRAKQGPVRLFFRKGLVTDGDGHLFHIGKEEEEGGVHRVWFPDYFGTWWVGTVVIPATGAMDCVVTDPVTDCYDPMQKVLVQLWKTPTGRALCDSGGEMQDDGTFVQGYSRTWEKAQRRVFLDEPKSELYVSILEDNKPEFDVTHNTWWWLQDQLALDQDLADAFDAFIKDRVDLKEAAWLEVMEEFAKLASGGSESVVNTYNEESLLDNILQYVIWPQGEYERVLLQVHGGCDARGGYGKPGAFFLKRHSQLRSPWNGDLECDHCGARWFFRGRSPWEGESAGGCWTSEDVKIYTKKDMPKRGNHLLWESEHSVRCHMCRKGHLLPRY